MQVVLKYNAAIHGNTQVKYKYIKKVLKYNIWEMHLVSFHHRLGGDYIFLPPDTI